MDVLINHRLKELSNPKECIRKWGPKMAKKIFMRLDQFRAAENLSIMKNFGRCHELKADREGQLAIDLVHPDRMVFVPRGNKSDYYPADELIWEKVEAIEVIAIGDYHD